MQLTQYSRKVKTFNKNDLLKEVGVQRGFLESVSNTLKLINSNDINLKPAMERWAVTKSIMDKAYKQYHVETDIVDGVGLVVPVIENILNAVEKTIKSETDNIIDGATLTVRQANCLMFLDYCNYFLDYATNLIEVLLTMSLKNKDPEQAGVPKADIALLNKSAPLFLDIFMQLYRDRGDIAKRIINGADIAIDETAIDVLSNGKGEAFIKGLAVKEASAHYFLPMYWIKTLKMEYDLYRIRNMRASNESSAMKIEQLANRQQNSNDPKLDRQIQIYQDQIIKNRAKIEEIQESYE